MTVNAARFGVNALTDRAWLPLQRFHSFKALHNRR